MLVERLKLQSYDYVFSISAILPYWLVSIRIVHFQHVELEWSGPPNVLNRLHPHAASFQNLKSSPMVFSSQCYLLHMDPNPWCVFRASKEGAKFSRAQAIPGRRADGNAHPAGGTPTANAHRATPNANAKQERSRLPPACASISWLQPPSNPDRTPCLRASAAAASSAFPRFQWPPGQRARTRVPGGH